ncbi:NTPase [Psychrobacter cryohalolentis]|uniref:P-loop NTPase fold protein n=1 Tax=Psychrobacter sp. D2 TaxID=2759702 RepID=UPI0015E5FF77|nr:P-loop NTPase fold protein [Psychrobacter sp. D2]MBA2057012.1 NTPase [Psychrobacter sp. D2]
MANVTNLEKKLVKLIETEKPCAIALTGEWGVGKTQFWNNFKKKHHDQFKLRKYAYVSLFGIDSLESLKYEIAVKTHKADQSEDRMQGAKLLFNKALDTVDLSSIEGKGLSLNIGKSLITSALSSLVSNTVICIDDVERISDSLSVKDVMGLVNDLKLEKNCQVIIILHDAKASEQFQEYKEKVLDEVLVFDDNLDILETFITDEIALEVMQLFYRTIKVKNLRFYKKIFNNYKQIITSIASLSKTSKEYILKNLLVIRWIDEFQPEIPLDDNKDSFKATLDLFHDSNSNFIIMSDDDFLNQSDKLKAFRHYLDAFYPLFLFDDWAKHIISMLTNHDISEDSIKDLLKRDVLSEVQLQDELAHEQVIDEFHSLELQPNFCERLYYSACTKIQKSEMNNVSFYCDILENCKRADLAQQLETHAKQFIKNKIKSSQSKPSIDNWYRFGRQPHDRFYDFIQNEIENYKISNIKSSLISTIFLNFHDHNRNGWNSSDKDTISMIDKDILEELIWADLDDKKYRKHFIHSILLHPVLNEIEGKREEVRQWIIELLNEKISISPERKAPIKMWLSSTDNLTKNLF